jgi:hypothetical protein
MSDDIREEAAGEQPAVTEKAAEKPAGTLAETGAIDPPAKAETAAAEPAKEAARVSWPEDWRDAMSGGDDKVKNLLARYTSPDALAKAFKEQRDALAKKPAAKEDAGDLPENATPEQLSAWRKAKGVPEKPEDYEFEVPEGKELADAEYEILMDFAKSMHESNMPADTVKKISSWFLEYEETVAQRNAEKAYQVRLDTEEKLRAEWAGDYRANVNLMSNVLQEHLGTKSSEFLGQQLMDGSRIGDNETFIRLMAEVARKIGGSTADLYTSDVQTTGKGLEARKAELLAMSTDPAREKEYRSPKIQEEMKRIYDALARRAS